VIKPGIMTVRYVGDCRTGRRVLLSRSNCDRADVIHIYAVLVDGKLALTEGGCICVVRCLKRGERSCRRRAGQPRAELVFRTSVGDYKIHKNVRVVDR
jgi:hypothetical protein